MSFHGATTEGNTEADVLDVQVWSRSFHEASTGKRMGRSIVVVANKQKDKEARTLIPEGVINIWWSSESNGALMLLLAYLLKRNPEWRTLPGDVLLVYNAGDVSLQA